MSKTTYRQESVKCGKPGCRSCPHGPYWYSYRREDGKLHKKYHGKEDPREGQAREDGEAPRAGPKESRGDHPHDAIFNRVKRSIPLACKILGCSERIGYADAQRLYRQLAMKHHPDREGDAVVMCRINVAYDYLREVRGWHRL